MILLNALLLVIALACNAAVGVRLFRAARLYRVRRNYTAARTAPSVSVCIPARNEMHAMAACLERVLASDYQKMEVIVYDDHSHDDTSIIIRSFAHAGVRFVEGTPLPNGWLGRNHAFDVLAREASGSYILFMDVDTFIEPTTISELVGYIMTEKLEMVSVIPSESRLQFMAALLGHLRFFWELILSHTRRPAVSGMVWMMKRDVFLGQYDGFNHLKLSVQPEIEIARQIGADRYHCLLPTSRLGVSYEKKSSSQLETSLRLLYPLSGASFWSRLRFVIFLVALNLPFWGFVVTLSTGGSYWSALGWLMSIVFSAGMYAYYHYLVGMKGWILGGLGWSYNILRELVIYIMSFVAYKTGRVTWKGRAVSAQSLPR